MTNDGLKEYLSYFAKASDMPAEGMDTHLDTCVQFGLAEFWGWWCRFLTVVQNNSLGPVAG